MPDARADLGRRGEDEAAKYLTAAGYKIVDRNVRSKLGEIDIVASREDLLVFVEVKAGRFDPDFPPELHWTAQKQRKVLTLGKVYLSRLNSRLKKTHNARFDLIVVTEKYGQLQVDPFEDVLQDARL